MPDSFSPLVALQSVHVHALSPKYEAPHQEEEGLDANRSERHCENIGGLRGAPHWLSSDQRAECPHAPWGVPVIWAKLMPLRPYLSTALRRASTLDYGYGLRVCRSSFDFSYLSRWPACKMARL